MSTAALDYETIKDYYDRGLWPIGYVWNAVGRVITEEEYFSITGFVYPAKE